MDPWVLSVASPEPPDLLAHHPTPGTETNVREEPLLKPITFPGNTHLPIAPGGASPTGLIMCLAGCAWTPRAYVVRLIKGRLLVAGSIGRLPG